MCECLSVKCAAILSSVLIQYQPIIYLHYAFRQLCTANANPVPPSMAKRLLYLKHIYFMCTPLTCLLECLGMKGKTQSIFKGILGAVTLVSIHY